MTATRRILTAPMTCLLPLLCGLAMAQGTSVTVIDNAQQPNLTTRWTQFSDTLSASVADPPQSTTETTITGPTYQWSCSNPSPGFTASGGSTGTLTSSDSTSTIGLTAGNNSLSVSCTVTYTSTDNKTGATTPLSFSGSANVTFYVRVPVQVMQISNKPYEGSPFSGPSIWGHENAYHLEVLDNQGNAYGYGAPQEEFPGTIEYGPPPTPLAGQQPNGPAGPYTWPTGSDFTDYIGFYIRKNMAADYGWNVITLTMKFNQRFHCLEQPDHDTPLNTFVITNDYQTCTRD